MTAAPIESHQSGLVEMQQRIASLQSLVRPSRTAVAGASSFDGVLRTQLAGAPGASGASGTNPVDIAKKYLGVPYRWGGTDPSTGLDCSGLVQLVYRQAGVDLPRVAADQARVGQPVADLSSARPGDLVFFGSPVDHVGIYAGDGKMVVAPHTGDVVKIENISSTPTAIRRVMAAPTATPTPYGDLFAAAGAKYGVDPSLLAAVAKTESGFDPTAVSPAGARGLMQIMPSTAAGLGVDPMNPAQAIDGAARLLASNLQTFGSEPLAVAAYNAGAGAVSRYGGVPPYAETQHYVQKVMATANDFRSSALDPVTAAPANVRSAAASNGSDLVSNILLSGQRIGYGVGSDSVQRALDDYRTASGIVSPLSAMDGQSLGLDTGVLA